MLKGSFNPVEYGLFRGFSLIGGGGGVERPPSLNSHINAAMMKLDTVTLYQKKSKKHINHVTHSLNSPDINIFLPEISNFCSITK